jgi:AcrR family transcriptional regulator
MKKRSRIGDRRKALVRAAYGVIAKKGFEGLRLREVATKAGIDHSTLHHHFGTKRDLVAAVLDYAIDQFRPPLRPESTEPTSLHEHLSLLAQLIAGKPDLHVVLREFDLHAARDPRLRTIIAQREEGWRDRLAQRLGSEAEHGHLAPQCEPASCAELIIAVVKGASFNPGTATEVLNSLEKLLVQQSAPAKSRGARS